jgi:hypothetical protein
MSRPNGNAGPHPVNNVTMKEDANRLKLLLDNDIRLTCA